MDDSLLEFLERKVKVKNSFKCIKKEIRKRNFYENKMYSRQKADIFRCVYEYKFTEGYEPCYVVIYSLNGDDCVILFVKEINRENIGKELQQIDKNIGLKIKLEMA